jgi:hypothetical protein
MGRMQIGHLLTGPTQSLQRTMCMQGKTTMLLLFRRQTQQDSILFLSYLIRTNVAKHSDSILSSFSLVKLSYLKDKSQIGFLFEVSSLQSFMREKERSVSC